MALFHRAYSGETVNISIASAQSTKIGHMIFGDLSVQGQNAVTVKLSIYSALRDETFVLESVNGVEIGSLSVAANDSNGNLVKAINQKTALHGVIASTDEKGYLTLTSADHRAIRVDVGSGTQSVLGNTDMSTLGKVTLNQEGATAIVVRDVGGGNVVSLTNTLETQGNTTTTIDSTLADGSQLANGSVLGPGWATNQKILRSNFTSDMTTSQESRLSVGTFMGGGSTLAGGTPLGGSVQVAANANTKADWELAKGTVLIAKTQFASGTIWGGSINIDTYTLNGTQVTGGDINATADTVLRPSYTVAAGSIFSSDSMILKIGTSVTLTTDITF